MAKLVEMFRDVRFIVLIVSICVGIFALVFLLKLRPREIRVFITIFAIGMVAIAGMYILTFFQPSLSVFYAYAVLATATGILLFIYYRYFAS